GTAARGLLRRELIRAQIQDPQLAVADRQQEVVGDVDRRDGARPEAAVDLAELGVAVGDGIVSLELILSLIEHALAVGIPRTGRGADGLEGLRPLAPGAAREVEEPGDGVGAGVAAEAK